MTPTTEPAKRIATLFKRRLSTPWSAKEIRQFKALAKMGVFTSLEDLQLVEAYYVWNMNKPDNFLRRDLSTFLNNFMGEVDRARAWAERNKAKVRKSNPERRTRTFARKPLSDEEFKSVGKLAIEQLRAWRLAQQQPQQSQQSA